MYRNFDFEISEDSLYPMLPSNSRFLPSLSKNNSAQHENYNSAKHTILNTP